MKLRDLISDLEQFAARMGEDAVVTLYDKNTGRTLRSDADTDDWDFEVLRGDNEVVIEFD